MEIAYEVELRECPGCRVEMDKWEMEEVSDAQGIYVGRYCTYECARRNSGIMLNRTLSEAMAGGDWGDED